MGEGICMDEKRLSHILMIAKEQNITHAAEKLYITRSALNYSLLNLEKELGFSLFKRLSNKLIPTYEGELYLKKAQQIVNLYHELDHIMESFTDEGYGRINLGVTVNTGQKNLMEIFPAFHKQYPNYTFQLIEGNVKYLEQRLLDGTIDLAWAGFYYEHSLVEHIITHRVPPLRLAIAREHPLVAQHHLDEKDGATLSLDLLKDQPFILMNKHTFVRGILDSYFDYAGFEPKVMIECSRMDMAHHFVSQGIAPGFLFPENNDYGQRLLFFKLKPDLETPYQTIFFRKGQIFTEAETYLIELYKQNRHYHYQSDI